MKALILISYITNKASLAVVKYLFRMTTFQFWVQLITYKQCTEYYRYIRDCHVHHLVKITPIHTLSFTNNYLYTNAWIIKDCLADDHDLLILWAEMLTLHLDLSLCVYMYKSNIVPMITHLLRNQMRRNHSQMDTSFTDSFRVNML